MCDYYINYFTLLISLFYVFCCVYNKKSSPYLKYWTRVASRFSRPSKSRLGSALLRKTTSTSTSSRAGWKKSAWNRLKVYFMLWAVLGGKMVFDQNDAWLKWYLTKAKLDQSDTWWKQYLIKAILHQSNSWLKQYLNNWTIKTRNIWLKSNVFWGGGECGSIFERS